MQKGLLQNIKKEMLQLSATSKLMQMLVKNRAEQQKHVQKLQFGAKIYNTNVNPCHIS